MSKTWEVDPQTRSKLLEIAKTNGNNRCVDCNVPNPQWASPKFGIFFCLACSGIHRSLGVHISFVRSISMDSFKVAEVRRMELGGNKPWQDFFTAHASNTLVGRDFDGSTIAERYDSDAGEEWKDRLTAKVEGTDYVPGTSKPARTTAAVAASRTSTPAGSGRSTPAAGGVRGGPAATSIAAPQRTASPAQKTRNEAFFASKGEENASRPDHLPPSQGGKYGGFGSDPGPTSTDDDGAGANTLPSTDEFQRDPVAALTRGFGWLSSTVTRQAASVNKAYIQPGVKSLADGELAATAQRAAVQLGGAAQQGVRGLGDQFNRFVDPENPATGTTHGARGAPEKKDFWDAFGQQEPAAGGAGGPPREKREFWDDFAAAAGDAAGRQNKGGAAAAKPTSIGTSAMKTSTGGGGMAGGKKDEDGGWGEW